MRRWSCLLVVLICCGCRAGVATLEQGRSAYFAGDFESARISLAEGAKTRRVGEVAKLDLAMVELASGNPARCDGLLRECRDQFDRRDPPDTVPSARSLMTDERDMPYDAAGYEDVMIRSLLSIASLMSESGDAESYAMQAQLHQAQLAARAEEKGLENVGQVYQPLALAPYVRGLIRESNHHDYDDAERAYQLVAQWQPSFPLAESDILRAAEGTHSRPGHGVLYVFALVGRGPVRKADYAEASGAALLIADRIVAASTDYAIPPTLAPIPIPRVVVPPCAVDRIGIRVDGRPTGTTAILTDVGQLAARQVEAEMPWTVARGVVRRVAKKAVVATTLNSVAGGNALAETGGALLGSVWEATEQADLRCWGLLPREIQVIRIELPAGVHTIAADAIGSVRRNVTAEADVSIRDGMNSYMLVVAPDDRVTALCCGVGATP